MELSEKIETPEVVEEMNKMLESVQKISIPVKTSLPKSSQKT